MKWARVVAALVVLAHLAVATRYDFFRDELYFIVCGRHPSWGYADQPPIVPLLAAASQAFGEHLFLLRSITALAHGGTVLVTAALARRLAGSGVLAAIAVACAPMYLGLSTVLNTSAFEPLLWTAIALCIVRAVEGEPRFFVWAGVLAGLDLEIKYELPIYLLPLFLTIVPKRIWRRELLLGIVAMIAIAAASLVWQLTHCLPFRELVRAAGSGKNVVVSPLAFLANQALVMNPLLTPVWLAGFFCRRARFLAVAFAISLVAMIALHAKDYYAAPLFAVMFALGSVVIERVRWAAIAVGIGATLFALGAAPMAMPILSPAMLTKYPLQPKPAETLEQAPIPQTFADMFGWRELANEATRLHALYPELPFVAGNYGDAGALDVYARVPVVSGHNHYGYLGPRYTGTRVLVMTERLSKLCTEATPVGHFGDNRWAMPFEQNRTIWLCTLRAPLDQLWDSDVRFMY